MLVDLGQALIRAGQPEEAVEVLERAIAKNRKDPDARVMLAEAKEALGQNDAALALLREAVGLSPGHRLARMREGRLLEKRKDLPAAIEAYRAAVQADPTDPGALAALGRALLAAGREEEAVEVRKTLDQLLASP